MARHLHQQRAPAVVPAAPAVVPAAPAAVPASPARESATPAAPAAPAAVLTAPARKSAAPAAPAEVPAAPARKSTVPVAAPAAVQQPQQRFFPVGEAMETWRGGSETESEDEQQPIKPHNANRRAMLRALYAGNNGESAIVVD